MNIRTYRLTSVATTTSVGQASSQIVARGKIVGVLISASVVGPAGASTGRLSSELALNNNVNGQAEQATGAPPEYLVARASLAMAQNSSGQISQFVPLSIPVVPGNFVCINVLQTGGTAQHALHGYDVMVQEG